MEAHLLDDEGAVGMARLVEVPQCSLSSCRAGVHARPLFDQELHQPLICAAEHGVVDGRLQVFVHPVSKGGAGTQRV